MTRAALVIGLGGTGQWVLTYLKKDLMETNGGKMPNNVRLVCYDTIPVAGANVANVQQAGQTTNISIGSVRLDQNTEYVHLEGNALADTQVICEDSRLPDESQRKWGHISSWYQSCTWLEALPPPMFLFSHGCSQVRQLGRMALFFDLKNTGKSKVYASLNTAITELSKHIQKEGRLEIIVVGSFAGGTGSGLFIDIGLLLRNWTQNMDVQMRAYYVLPRAFTANPSQDMLARCFAAWRELNRFMTITNEFYLPKVVYNPTDNLVIREVKKKLYDACYLVDGSRNDTPITTSTEQTIFPSISDAISALLDDTAGQKYDEWVTNMSGDYIKHRGKPLYSTVGTYSFQVPVYFERQNFSDKFMLNWVENLVKPRMDPERPGRVVMVDPTSPNDPSKVGREEALTMLTTNREMDNPEPEKPRLTEAPTLFFKMISDIINSGGVNNLDLVTNYARGSWQGRTFAPFIDLGNRQGMAGIIQQINTEANLRVQSAIKASKDFNKEDTKRFPDRVEREYTEFEKTHYGYRDTHGNDVKGKFGDQLKLCSEAQLAIFQRLVDYWLVDTLNGGTKAGRIGYAYDLMVGLVGARGDKDYKGALVNFLEFLESVRKKRTEVNPGVQVQQERARARQSMVSFAGKKIVGLVDDPRAHETQITYLNALQKVVDVRRDEILSYYVTETLREMIRYCETVRDELERWIRILAVGDPGTGVDGLYTVLEKRRRESESAQLADNALSPVRSRVGEITYPDAQKDSVLNQLMNSMKWHIASHEPYRLSLTVLAQAAQAMGVAVTPAQQVSGSLTQESLGALQSYAIKEFNNVNQDTRINIADVLTQIYQSDAHAFSELIGSKAEPLFERQPALAGGAAKWSELIRINLASASPEARLFIKGSVEEDTASNVITVKQKGVLQERREHYSLPAAQVNQEKYVDIAESADKYKCTIVRTDDLMSHELFKAWNDCLQAYLNPDVKVPPYLNHNFPAEANAARYEKMIADKRMEKYRIFHPWVVMLLEHPERLEDFFLAYAMGWLTLEIQNPNQWYQLQIPSLGRPFYLTPSSNTLWSVFQAARAFVLDGIDRSSPTSTLTLNYGAIRRDLEEAERQMGADKFIEFLQNQLQKIQLGTEFNLVLNWLDDTVRDLQALQGSGSRGLPVGEPADFAQAYKDMADVAEMMLTEMLDKRNAIKLKQSKMNR